MWIFQKLRQLRSSSPGRLKQQLVLTHDHSWQGFGLDSCEFRHLFYLATTIPSGITYPNFRFEVVVIHTLRGQQNKNK